MRNKRATCCCWPGLKLWSLLGLLLLLSVTGSPAAANTNNEFRVVIMQAQKGAAQKYRPLEDYLRQQGINIRFIGARSYQAAARLFSEGQADGMFSGSGVAAVMLLKNLATPAVRPVDRHGHSSYWAVVLAPKGAAKFSGSAGYFQGQRVICCALASSGEFYLRSLTGASASQVNQVKAPSHGAAIAGLAAGAADFAIVKNRVWDQLKGEYPQLVKVGEDQGENPNGTLIVANRADPQLVKKLTDILLKLQDDPSEAAEKVRREMAIKQYRPTSMKDFSHTLALLKKAGVDASFNFSF